MVMLDATVVNIARPEAQRDLGFSAGSWQWVIMGYALAFGSLLLLGSRLGDLLARRSLFVIGLAGFEAVAASLGYSPIKTGLAFLPMVAAGVVSSATIFLLVLPKLGPRSSSASASWSRQPGWPC
ncbi:hypothetical protein ACIRSS_23445 [Amycolatopsis sp. NPDC101161]|uniref:hypothetical protein n=1 Tax=Amycolatopsis sp. NPDC101161 TaxID=3363940 RepID=UPI003801807A